MRWLSDPQQELVIRTIAKIPLPMARRDFLERLEPKLRAKMSDEQVVEAINATLAQFEPGHYRVDSSGRVERRDDPVDENMTLQEAAARYQRLLREDPDERFWPPYPPRPPRPPGEREIKSAPMSPEQLRAGVEEYDRMLFSSGRDEECSDEEWAEEKRRRANEEAERLAAQARWPVDPSPPPREAAQLIRGEAVELEPEPEPPPSDDDPDPKPPRDPAPTRSQAIREAIEMARKRGRGRPRKPPPAFFR